MQNLVPVIAFAAGFLLAWLLLRNRKDPQTAILAAQLAERERQAAEKDSLIATLREKAGALATHEAELGALLKAEQAAGAEKTAALEQARSAVNEASAQLAARGAQLAELTARLEAERSAAAEKIAMLDEARNKLSDAFRALAAEALQTNNQAFLDLAKVTLEKAQEAARGELDQRRQAIDETLRPVRESLEKVDAKIQELEKARQGAYAELTTQVRGLLSTQAELRVETGRLVSALRTPGVRGNWGEMQLRRVVEMAGMLEHCDFFTQPSVDTENGRLRPDLLVRLPAGKSIIVDAKTPLEAYLRAAEATDDETRKQHMQDHARQVREHLAALGRKGYWQQFDPTPEFVVLFLPGECFFSAALENDPTLIEYGVEQNVIPATPTTLIALLRAVAYGWRQEDLARNAKEIREVGAELYKRIATLRDHWKDVGKNLGTAMEAYNRAVGSFNERVLPGARRFVELRAATGEAMEALPAVEKPVRELSAGK